jgi:hypothetical protein
MNSAIPFLSGRLRRWSVLSLACSCEVVDLQVLIAHICHATAGGGCAGIRDRICPGAISSGAGWRAFKREIEKPSPRRETAMHRRRARSCIPRCPTEPRFFVVRAAPIPPPKAFLGGDIEIESTSRRSWPVRSIVLPEVQAVLLCSGFSFQVRHPGTVRGQLACPVSPVPTGQEHRTERSMVSSAAREWEAMVGSQASQTIADFMQLRNAARAKLGSEAKISVRSKFLNLMMRGIQAIHRFAESTEKGGPAISCCGYSRVMSNV